ncbi:group II intron reverse transcriptase domain-containing protein [Candidatus Uhrbacteria bacterium]|nr:group II intron reverse transcriptase domain-containing protein [Candidatus Uhrbacteria bacterium]
MLAFAAYCEDDIFALYDHLARGTYRHSAYEQFYVHDPKRRHISKAIVDDRVVHQALVQVLEPMVEPSFIFDSYASREGKGTHAAIARFAGFLRRASRNNQRTVFILKCDIRKFFDSIRHDILLALLSRIVQDEPLFALCAEIVRSYRSAQGIGRGLPLGNVTSQLFANIYLSSFDHFIKEELRIQWYVRFCDDFLIAHHDRHVLDAFIPRIQEFLSVRCGLELHPKKVTIRKYMQGIDVLGTVVRPNAQTIRTNTKRRMMRRLRFVIQRHQSKDFSQEQLRATLQSYHGLLTHGDHRRIRSIVEEETWRALTEWTEGESNP